MKSYLKLSFISYYYPNDQFILSLKNHLNIFSLLSSSLKYLFIKNKSKFNIKINLFIKYSNKT